MNNDHRRATIRTSPLPAELNINGNIFGGWVLSQMDIAGGIAAARAAKGRVATVAIESMKFVAPINVGDVISVYTDVIHVGNTSVNIKICVYSDDRDNPDHEEKVTEANFIFVAIGEDGKPRPIEQ